LGIAAVEDKIVQQAVVEVLNQIYEGDFAGLSYGFRPGRSAHDALDSLTAGIMTKKVNWILDADIKGFFDNISHEKLMELIELRIADPRIQRLIRKWLTAGVSEDGQWSATKVGTPDQRRSGTVNLVQDKLDSWSAPVASGDLAAACQHLPALRARPVGDRMAQSPCKRRCDDRPLCG
jgi:retron-type reverse transcriptase